MKLLPQRLALLRNFRLGFALLLALGFELLELLLGFFSLILEDQIFEGALFPVELLVLGEIFFLLLERVQLLDDLREQRVHLRAVVFRLSDQFHRL